MLGFKEADKMKQIKRVISIVLCVALLTGVGASAFAISADDYKNIPYTGYTYIGDSIAWGFGLDRSHDPASPDYVCSREIGAYGDLVGRVIEQKNDGSVFSAATSGARLSDYRMLIENGMGKTNPYTFTDWYGENREPERSKQLMSMSAEICSWLSQSDLVSIQLGYNDLLAAPMFTLQDSGILDDIMLLLESEDPEPESFAELLSADAKLTTAMKDKLGEISKILLNGVKSFRENSKALIVDINELTGKTADIVFVGYYNPYRTLKENANSDLSPLLDTMSMIVATMNDYFSELADKYENVYYVDAADVSVFFEDGMLYEDATSDPDAMLYGAHPDEEGHAYVADKILSLLDKVNTCPIYAHDFLFKSVFVFPDILMKTFAKLAVLRTNQIFVSIFHSIFHW